MSEQELADALRYLEGWSVVQGKLHRKVTFKGFAEAFAFMTSVALLAEAMQHHPDWSNAYDTVVIDLTTHDLGGLSTYDIQLATRINEVLS